MKLRYLFSCFTILSDVLAFSPIRKPCLTLRAPRSQNMEDADTMLTKSSFLSDDDNRNLLPWTQFQDWALRDNIEKYIVSIPLKGSDEPSVFVLWRTLSRDVIELQGYPVDMLQRKYQELCDDSEISMSMKKMPLAMPLIDEYEFTLAGGLRGNVYGIPGVAEGTKIETPSVTEIQSTLPLGYVRANDPNVFYELGKPLQTSVYSLDGMNRSSISPQNLFSASSRNDNLKGSMSTSTEALIGDELILRLSTLTAALLAGATAIDLLSHHLTVNVFWV
jgi:hypothetical protein